jgi:hypothetical protein
MKAFISSTVTDLAEYRSVVHDVLSDLGVQYVTLGDLLPKSPPLTLTSSEDVLQELDRSDLVILILGHRYGSSALNPLGSPQERCVNLRSPIACVGIQGSRVRP